jgi:hypothetical protein
MVQPQILFAFTDVTIGTPGSLIASLEEVSASVAVAYNVARSGWHNTKKIFLYRNKTQKSISNRFYYFKRQREPSGGVAGRGVLLYHKKRLSII